ncbi:MAG: DNA-3-methyladenine glycosylase [Chitinophagaceae bacterium]|nr:DNA-3-methyladenine glycosylase [Chitinophagaceae bacterium]
MKKLDRQFYLGKDVVALARNLIGKRLVTRFNGEVTVARIIETEAYIGLADKASHSFGGRRTARNEHMYALGGTAYVYICYGMHHLFNVVTNEKDIPDAVLIRAADPLQGTEIMLKRSGKKKMDHTLTRGPGNLSKAMGISKWHSGTDLVQKMIYLEDDGLALDDELIGCSRRIGVESSGEAALLPYRFYLRWNPYVSSYPKH